tara:strand:- start:634 stop:801 length:168 start_codon:yes stop_codon:yes gene_type:complete
MKVGDLVSFLPEYNGEEWANRLGIVIQLTQETAMIVCSGEQYSVALYTVEVVGEG